MNGQFWQWTLSGIIVSWPGIAVSVWLGVRGLKKHVDTRTSSQTRDIRQLTDAQTGDIRQMTDAQTRVLTRRRWHRRGRSNRSAAT